MAQYEVNNSSIQTLLSWIRSGEIAIPEIQRPFVWDSTKVRDLIDSLYAGFPVGYIIVWKNPDVRLKDGTVSSGKKILIDGQQRITALQAAVVGIPVIGSDYHKKESKLLFIPWNNDLRWLTLPLRKMPPGSLTLHLFINLGLIPLIL